MAPMRPWAVDGRLSVPGIAIGRAGDEGRPTGRLASSARIAIIPQYTVDTLYYLSYLHLRGRTDTHPTDRTPRAWETSIRTLKKYLQFRAQDRASTIGEAADADDGRQDLLTDDILDFLFTRVLENTSTCCVSHTE